MQCLEQRIASDLPWAGVQEMALLAMELKDDASIRASLTSKCPTQAEGLKQDVALWQDDPDLRRAIGLAAKNRRWFKTLDGGFRLGQIVTKHLEHIATTPLSSAVTELRVWTDFS